ncbi:MAG TPA: cytochrome c biogenesis protein CcsA [Chloroflexota bacterium]|nr:cytochrome c biogenesis protein CcsA [Chloroflexota bacterium]
MRVGTISRAPQQERAIGPSVSWLDRILAAATLISFVAALYLAFVYAPTEAVQGDVQRIFYFHVPIAWLAYLAFFVVFCGSIIYLWKRSEAWDIAARCSAELGVVFTTLVLITGSIWGRPTWGAWWAWDARMTSTLILWSVYVVYLMLRAYSTDRQRGARYGAVLGIIGFADVPIVQMSITWWRTLHPAPVVSLEGSGSLPPEMLLALMVSLLAFTLFYVWMLRQRIQVEWLRAEIDAAREANERG